MDTNRDIAENLDGNIPHVFTYDAYGNPIGFTNAQALTNHLYSGEWTDTTTGWQYLRARYYDPASGRFIRLDDFAGNANDPQTLHKYTYTHGDPVQLADPTGEFEGLVGTLAAIGISLNVVSLAADITTAFGAAGRNSHNEAAQAASWAIVDALFLTLPFSGLGGSAARAAVSIGGSILPFATSLSRVGLAASAIWGYLRTLAPALAGLNFTFSTGTGGSSLVGSNLGGPGQVVDVGEVMPEMAARYQQQVGGLSGGLSYEVNGVRFDGFSGSLLEAKGPGYSRLIQDLGIARELAERFVDQARRQLRAAKGTAIKWFAAEQDVAEGITRIFRESNISGIVVEHRPVQFP